LDSSALIALVSLEPGYQRVAELIGRSSISAVNLTETINKIIQKVPTIDAVRGLLAQLDLKVEDWSEDLAFRSAEFAPFNKSHGLSLGDRACLTLAKQLRATAVTSDRAWKRLPSLGVSVMLFR
jgi:PIN domain nuclease of toxin-antitoxin system